MKSLMKKIVFYATAITLAGCVPSLHRLYVDDNDLVFEEKLLGDFQSKEPDWKWSFERHTKDSKNYKMTVIDEKKKSGQFNVHLVKIDDMKFLDIFPGGDDPNWPQNDYYQLHIFPVHTFIKIDFTEPNIALNFMDIGDMDKMLKKNPNIIKHELIDNDALVLTASPKELQQFMRDYANDPNVFGDPIALARISDPNEKVEKPQ
jgi:hypothetical protein